MGRFFNLWIVICFFSVQPVHAQLSLKMGYGIGFIKEEPNKIFAELRNRKKFLSLEDKRYRNMQGLALGVRFAQEHIAMEFDLDYRFWTIEGSGKDSTGTLEKLKASITNASLGYSIEYLYDNFGIGTSFHYNFFSQRIKHNIKGNLKDKSKYLSQKVFVGLYIPGGRNTILAFRPYIEIPYGNVNFYFMERGLGNRRNELKRSDFDYRPSSFGIQLMFLNGGIR